MSLFLTVLGISLLIVLHELGHFALARAFGMRVLRFSVGFGPPLVSRQLGDTIWQIAVIPLGGFVHIHGMGAGEPVGNDGKSFRDKPLWQRALVILAGPLANWLIAAVCLAALAGSVGLQHYDESRTVLGEIVEGEAAAQSGLRSGDEVRAVAGVDVTDWQSFVTEVRKHAQEPVTFGVLRDGHKLEIEVTPRRSDDGDFGVIGVLPHANVERLRALPAIGAGFRGAWRLTAQQASLLWGVLAGTQEGRLTGLPGIVKMVSEQAQHGLSRLLQALAVLSVVLALLNLLPVPALDGSRLVFLGIEGARGRPVNELIEGWVHAAGFVLLLGLMIFVSLRDLL